MKNHIKLSLEIWPNMPYGDRPIVGPVVNSWGDKPIEWCIERLKEYGYEGFDVVYPKFQELSESELNETAKKIKELSKSYEMEFSSIGAHFLTISPRKWHVDAGIKSFKEAIDVAEKTGAKTVVSFMRGGYYNPPTYVFLPWKKAREICVNQLKEVASYAENRGVMVSIEPHIETFLNDVDLTLDVINEVGSDNLYVCVDVGALYIQIKPHMPVPEAIEKLGDRINIVHLKDVTGVIGNWHMVWYGGGIVNFKELGRALKSINYKHYATVEWEGWFVGGPFGRGEPGGVGLTDFDRVAQEIKAFFEKEFSV